MYTFRPEELDEIKKLYLQGHSSIEIKEITRYPQSARSIQRNLVSMGIIRTRSESFKLAIQNGRMKYYTKGVKSDRRIVLNKHIRYQVLEKYRHRCSSCGATPQTADITLNIDHINEDKNDNRLDNLQVLCDDCNRGKFYASGKHFSPTRKPQ